MRAMTAGKRRGFTLVEMLVVIAIIAVLAALAFPALTAARASATRSTATSHMAQIVTALGQFNADFGHYPWAADAWHAGSANGNDTEAWNAYAGGAANGTAHVENNMRLAFWLAGKDTNASAIRWDSFDKNTYGDAGDYLKRNEAGLANELHGNGGNPAALSALYAPAPFSHFFVDPWGKPYIYVYRTDKTRRCQAACLTSATCTAHGVSYSAAERQRWGRNGGAPVPNEGFETSFELWSAGPDKAFDTDLRPDGASTSGLNRDNLAGVAYE